MLETDTGSTALRSHGVTAVITSRMRASLLCRVSNATARAVGRCDRAALGLRLRTSCSLAVASPAILPSSVGLGGAVRWPPQVSNIGRVNMARGMVTEAAEKLTQVNHSADNLACTPSESTQHSHATNAERKSHAPKRSKPVLGRRHGSEGEWVEYESIMAAVRALGLRPGCVSACCRGKQKRTGEYEFKWAPLAEDQQDRPGEEWRKVQLECGASRMVSNLGRVLTARGIKTEGSEHPSGYMIASINGKKHLVHRLVAQAFLPPPPSEKHTQVTHIDGDPANNRADNLEWVPPSG